MVFCDFCGARATLGVVEVQRLKVFCDFLLFELVLGLVRGAERLARESSNAKDSSPCCAPPPVAKPTSVLVLRTQCIMVLFKACLPMKWPGHWDCWDHGGNSGRRFCLAEGPWRWRNVLLGWRVEEGAGFSPIRTPAARPAPPLLDGPRLAPVEHARRLPLQHPLHGPVHVAVPIEGQDAHGAVLLQRRVVAVHEVALRAQHAHGGVAAHAELSHLLGRCRGAPPVVAQHGVKVRAHLLHALQRPAAGARRAACPRRRSAARPPRRAAGSSRLRPLMRWRRSSTSVLEFL